MKRRGRRAQRNTGVLFVFFIAIALAVILWFYFNTKGEEMPVRETASIETSSETVVLPEGGMETGEIPDNP